MVNTFLLDADFAVSASYLDDSRLWKQILEATQIINSISGGKGWKNHPAVLMWAGFIPALKEYINAHLEEWKYRGKNNNSVNVYVIEEPIIYPWWLFTDQLYYSHRASLLRKNPEYYAELRAHIPETYLTRGYFWPSKFGPFENIEQAVISINELPLEKVLASVQVIIHCSAYYKNGKKCYAKGSQTVKGQPYCRRHSSS